METETNPGLTGPGSAAAATAFKAQASLRTPKAPPALDRSALSWFLSRWHPAAKSGILDKASQGVTTRERRTREAP
jgi:hypothetical protein